MTLGQWVYWHRRCIRREQEAHAAELHGSTVSIAASLGDKRAASIMQGIQRRLQDLWRIKPFPFSQYSRTE